MLVRPNVDGLEKSKNSDGTYLSKGGLVLMEETVNKERATYSEGTIVGFGPSVWKEDGGAVGWGIGIGDRVVYAKYAGAFLKDPKTKEQFIILNDADIICKVGE